MIAESPLASSIAKWVEEVGAEAAFVQVAFVQAAFVEAVGRSDAIGGYLVTVQLDRFVRGGRHAIALERNIEPKPISSAGAPADLRP